MEDASTVKKSKLSESTFIKKSSTPTDSTGSDRDTTPTRQLSVSSDSDSSDDEINPGILLFTAIAKDWLDSNGSVIIGQLLDRKKSTKRARK